MEDNDSHAVW